MLVRYVSTTYMICIRMGYISKTYPQAERRAAQPKEQAQNSSLEAVLIVALDCQEDQYLLEDSLFTL
jgi:hypothetical protein